MNLCPASVLDRLNCLLEPGGKLLLAETGLQHVVEPHPNFRIFFTMDPVFGEISRALRNRCVEIFLLNECEDTGAHSPREYQLAITKASQPLKELQASTTCTKILNKMSSLLTIEAIFSRSYNEALCRALSLSLIGIDPSLVARIAFDAVYPNQSYFHYSIGIPVDLGLSNTMIMLSTVLVNLVADKERCISILSSASARQLTHWSHCVQKSSMEQLDSLVGEVSDFNPDLVLPQILALLVYEELNAASSYSACYLRTLFASHFSDFCPIFFSVLNESCNLTFPGRRDGTDSAIHNLSVLAKYVSPIEGTDFFLFRWSILRTPLVMKEQLSRQSSFAISGNNYSSLSLFQIGHAIIEKRMLIEDLRVAIVHAVTKILLILDESILNIIKKPDALQRHVTWAYPLLALRDMFSRTLLDSSFHVTHPDIYVIRSLIPCRSFHGRR